MAVEFVQSTTNAIQTNTSVAVATPPALHLDGDLLIMAIATVPPTSVTGVPANWNFITAVSCGADFAGLNVRTYWKHASSEPATYSSTFTVADLYTTCVVALRGQDNSASAIDVAAVNSSISSDSMVIPSITTTKSNDFWLGFAFQYQAATLPAGFDLPAGWTTAAEVTSHHAAMMVGYRTLATSGASGTVIFSTSGGAAYNPWATLSIGIAESAGGAGGAVVLRLGAMLGVGH